MVGVREDEQLAAVHSDRVVLVDKRGLIRVGYEPTTQNKSPGFNYGIEQLLKEDS